MFLLYLQASPTTVLQLDYPVTGAGAQDRNKREDQTDVDVRKFIALKIKSNIFCEFSIKMYVKISFRNFVI